MKVAVIHDWLNGMRGGEVVLDSLLKIFPNADLFTLFYEPGKLNERIETRKITTAFTDRLPFKSRYRWYLPLFPTAIESFDLRGYDLVFSSSHCVAKGVIPDPDAIHISYVHSPMRYVWDLYYDYFPARKGLKFLAFQAVSNYLRMWDAASANRVDSFLANSAFVGRRIKKFYRRDSTIVHPPCLPEGFKVKKIQKEDFDLIVSAFAPYKRIDLAIEAYRKNGRRLKILGSGQEYKNLVKLLPPNVEILPHRPRSEVIEYLSKAKVFVFPGMEDFGIAPVEAQGYGTPVIAYGKGGALETVIGGKTGVFFKEQTVEALNSSLIESDSIEWNPKNFQTSVNRFTEEKFIIQISKAVDSINKNSSSRKGN
ncbi:glycosyltransferase, group 1 family protein [Leptospira fainei serovar Hurstbridge str. BUT 6]|uniref:Glycosyltransferase, group 1 family protein n=1 Tax=Leptospira fainei serovar Hurstbridge str. BUT 6 TaxID=1193011 RepID=S3UW16_9LEPT|nr:glycosyltransferase [Leptospira fainei]EPG74586.1 glycosyltransferase, group 1 family protein [Leptospira fainei serovar Hurstbridge str. BUT 6]